MFWKKDVRRKKGGRWACIDKRRAAARKYARSFRARNAKAERARCRGYYARNIEAERARNKTRIRLGDTFLGREHQFPAPSEAVVAFARNLKEARFGTNE
jgi:hypothetical protein